MIIGITGTLGAGKGTVVEYLKEKGFVQYSSSKLLGELVAAEGNPVTREYMSPMATKLQKEYSGGVVEKNYQEKYLVEKPENAVFEAIHRQSEADFLKSIGGIVIGVDADLETRYKRTTSRGEGEKDQVTLENFIEHSRIEDEGGGDEKRDNNIRAVINDADHVFENNGSVEELHDAVDAYLKTIHD